MTQLFTLSYVNTASHTIHLDRTFNDMTELMHFVFSRGLKVTSYQIIVTVTEG